jgi:hypothetical protein
MHEISAHALGILQIVTLMPFTRKLVVGSTLSNERTGMAVILDAASGVGLGYDLEVCERQMAMEGLPLLDYSALRFILFPFEKVSGLVEISNVANIS